MLEVYSTLPPFLPVSPIFNSFLKLLAATFVLKKVWTQTKTGTTTVPILIQTVWHSDNVSEK